MKTIVTEGALVKRINRQLAKEGQVLRKCRENSRWHRDLGHFFIVNDRNHIVATGCDLEELAKETNVLRIGERLS